MSNQKKISIIIPTYNRNKLLDLTLKSIGHQAIDREIYEIIVVDDGSTEDTREVIGAFEDRLPIRFFYQEDLGYRAASARNLGIMHATGEIILFIDSGILLGDGCIGRHLDSHSTSAGDIVVLGYILGLQEEESDDNFLTNLMSRLNVEETIKYLFDHSKYLDKREIVYRLCNSVLSTLPAPWALFWTGHVSVKRENLVQAGMFDTHYDSRWGMEDIDLGYRLYRMGVTYLLDRKAISIHYPHTCVTHHKKLQEKINKRYFYEKYKTPEAEYLQNLRTVELNLVLSRLTCS